MIGPRIVSTPRLNKNVKFLGSKSIFELPQCLTDSEALIIPYKINDFTKSIVPAKIFECFATGKPLVSTPLPDLVLNFKDSIYFAETPEEFLNALNQLNSGENKDLVLRRMEMAKDNSWDKRFEQVLSIIDRAIKQA
jgi:glycosyltransferase involved in cell wall biosynthesis